MNFLFAGFALIIININLSLWVSYAVKATGFALILVGLMEYSIHDKDVLAYRGNAVASAIAHGVFTAALVYASFKFSDRFLNYLGIVCGGVSTFVSIDLQKRLMVRILRSGEGKVVEDHDNHKVLMPFVADVKKLGKLWWRLTVSVVVNLGFDILNRLFHTEILVTVTGILAAAGKIVSIVFALVFLYRFNELRRGYEKTMEKLEQDT
ncbi:MAG: hypothetical protein IJ555_04565 [Ruminococcus sp.]|nr:hypothetical protein [Ruminococcus sp.]